MKPALLVELGVDRGESYFAFCQAAAENQTGTRLFGIDTWRGDQHAGGYDETMFAQVSGHNRDNYESFSTLLRSNFDDALTQFAETSIDVLHLDGLHTETAFTTTSIRGCRNSGRVEFSAPRRAGPKQRLRRVENLGGASTARPIVDLRRRTRPGRMAETAGQTAAGISRGTSRSA
jgi:hypothetical protein